jgi:zinc transport system substrate-binding protein
MLRSATIAFLATSLISTADAGDKGTHRALVADHTNGKLTLIELPSGKTIGHYGVEGPARLKANQSGRLIYVTQGKQGRVNVFDSGISTASHGDHFDVEVKAPKMLGTSFAGGKPSHVNEGNGVVAIFFDETGTAQVVEENALLSGKARFQTIKADLPHHGLTAPLNGHFARSVSQMVDGKAVAWGVDVIKRDGTSVIRSSDCPRLHGEAKMGAMSAFGCADGVLFLTETRGRYDFQKINYPDNLPKERMVRNLASSRTVKSFVGDFGTDGMVIIDPVTKAFTFTQLPSKRVSFTRDPLKGEQAFVMTEEGQLHRLNALTGKLERSLAVTEPYSMEGGWTVARPRLSASGGMVVVSDPAKGKVHLIDGEKMNLIRSIDMPGAPFDVVVVGAPEGDH